MFAKGEDFTVTLNGSVVGGITNIICSEFSEIYDICTFLSGSPYDKIKIKKYKIVITLDCPVDCPFPVLNDIDEVSVANDYSTVKYLGCVIDSIDVGINAQGITQAVIKIIADERMMTV